MPLDSCTPHDGDRGAIDRRRFLRDGLLGIGGALFLSLTGAVEAQQRTMQSGFRRLLWLQMDGGASDIDTFNPKPEGGAIQPLFRGIRTSVEGLRIVEEFPLLAQQMHRGVLFRARTASSTDHLAAQQTQLGIDRDHKHFLMRHNDRTIRTKYVYMETPQVINAFDYRREAFRTQDSQEIVRTREGAYPQPQILVPEEGRTPEQTLERIEVRQDLLTRMERAKERTSDVPALRRYDENRETALRLMRQAARATDVSDPRLLRRYCGDREHATGLSILRGRELIRSGMFHAVLIRLADSNAYGGWDTHDRAREMTRHMAPRLDRALTELIRDQVRGELEDTLIVVDTEFGRSTRLDDGGGTGRTHRRTHCSMLFHPALQGGRVIGDIHPRTGEPVGDERQGVVNDELWLQLVNEALVIPRERRDFAVRERVPMFTDGE